MDLSALALVAFVVGTAGNSVKAVPQFLRTAVRGRVAALSTTAVWLAFIANVLWLCFGLAIEDWLSVSLGIVQTALVTSVSRTSSPAAATLRSNRDMEDRWM